MSGSESGDVELRVTLVDRGFPPEVCRRIAHYVTTYKDLTILARVCTEFQREAERRLYHSVKITSGPSATIRFFKLVASCPRIGSYTRHLTIYSPAVPGLRLFDPTMSRAFVESFSNALQAMPALENLTFVDPDKSVHHVEGLDPPDVTGFPFQLVDFRTRCAFGRSLKRFLTSQLNLRTLVVADDVDCTGGDEELAIHAVSSGDTLSLGISPDAFPELRILHGPWPLLHDVAPGRPVRDVCTMLPKFKKDTDFDTFIQGFFGSLSKSSGPLLYLDLGENFTEDISMAVIEEAALCFPHLTYIGKPMLPQNNDYLPFLEQLSNFPKLRKIELSVSHFRPSIHCMPSAVVNQMGMYARDQLADIVFNMQWAFQRWTKRTIPDTEGGEWSEWILTDSGGRQT